MSYPYFEYDSSHTHTSHFDSIIHHTHIESEYGHHHTYPYTNTNMHWASSQVLQQEYDPYFDTCEYDWRDVPIP